jgi:para-nitrobenzyl esterase
MQGVLMVMLRKVTTKYGVLQGFSGGDPRITVFKGVPFAAPPVGENRFRAPQPPACWQGVREAREFAPASLQMRPGLDWTEFYTKELNPVGYEYKVSEDCLYLNIWSPAKNENERLPVFFYIHGGGYVGGYSYEMEFDGERVARKGCIMVTAGYRLSALGFFAHEELTREDPTASQGNYGFLDQMAAIDWVRDNIAAFGGDPERITIAGQSAGAGSVSAQIVSPLTEGKFQGAIMMSGGGLNGKNGFFKPWRSLKQAQQDGADLLKALNVKTVAEARRLPGEVIAMTGLHIHPQGRSGPFLWGPTLDGVYLKEDSFDAMMAGRYHRIRYMFGYCHDEGKMFNLHMSSLPMTVEDFQKDAIEKYGADAQRLLEIAGVKNEEDIRRLYVSDDYSMFALAHGCFAKLLSRQGNPGYLYLFDHDIPGGDGAGSYHGSDLWFVFDSLGRCWRPFTGKHYDLARQASTYFVNFVKTGDPNGPDSDGTPLPQWDAYLEERPVRMCFKETSEMQTVEESELLNLRQKHYMGLL